MILVDANLLLYAEDALAAHHPASRQWWERQLSGTEPVGLSWAVVTAYLRIATNSRVFARPLLIPEAVARVQSWLAQPPVSMLTPTAEHWAVLGKLLVESQASGNLVADAHLAALAIEHNAVLYSTDADFARFKGLKWRNPLRS